MTQKRGVFVLTDDILILHFGCWSLCVPSERQKSQIRNGRHAWLLRRMVSRHFALNFRIFKIHLKFYCFFLFRRFFEIRTKKRIVKTASVILWTSSLRESEERVEIGRKTIILLILLYNIIIINYIVIIIFVIIHIVFIITRG